MEPMRCLHNLVAYEGRAVTIAGVSLISGELVHDDLLIVDTLDGFGGDENGLSFHSVALRNRGPPVLRASAEATRGRT
jgi:hypothetical protein